MGTWGKLIENIFGLYWRYSNEVEAKFTKGFLICSFHKEPHSKKCDYIQNRHTEGHDVRVKDGRPMSPVITAIRSHVKPLCDKGHIVVCLECDNSLNKYF